MGWKRLISRKMVVVALSWLGINSAALATQEELVILTTFSSEPVAGLIAQYKQANPRVDIKLIHRRTQSAIQLLNKSYIQDVDLVLSSSPFLMEQLHKRDQLAYVPNSAAMPDWLMPFVLPKQNKVVSVGYSGAGLVWNNDYLNDYQLVAPTQFKDLADARYFGHITMSTPSRSGTTQLMVESLLAKHGWQQGWAIILNVGANLGTISSRSFGVSDYVAKGQFGIGPTIDSYALVLPQQFRHVEFGYDPDFTLMPTYIGVVKNSGDNQATQRFIELLLSERVQDKMVSGDFAKHSIKDRSLYSSANPALNLEALMVRETLVNTIYDELITKRLPELQDVWHTLFEFQHRYADDAKLNARLNQLQRQLFAVPVSEHDVMALGTSIVHQTELDGLSSGVEKALLAEFSHHLGTKFDANLAQVSAQLRQLQAELML